MPTAKASPLTAGTWTIDPVHSSIEFAVRHLVVSTLRGRFETFSGAITLAEDGTPSVTAEIAVASVYTGNEQRDAHIRSAEFFDTEHFPTATFTSTAVKGDGANYLLTGDFTLKGITRPVTLSLIFNGVNPGAGQGEVAGFESSAVLNRKDFGIVTDMPLPTGGAVVGEEVTLSLAIEH